MTDPPPIVVVGAGLAGLAAACEIHRAGHQVVVYEASDGVGGRVRTDQVDGFRLDRGFQVLLTDYPEVRDRLDLDALDLQRFDPGALVWTGRRFGRVGDPLRSPTTLPASVVAPIGTFADKLRVLRLRQRLIGADARDLLRSEDGSTIDHLRYLGFSPRAIARFFRPLFGGILLDPDLGTSRRMFDVIFRSLARGGSAVPAHGMGTLPAQLTAALPPGTVHLNRPVEAVDPHGARLTGGERIEATAVVVAAEGPAAARLVPDLQVAPGRPVSCVYFSAPAAPIPERLVVLDGVGDGPVLNLAVMSNVASDYAPPGRALIAAACPGSFDDGLTDAARRQVRTWFGAQVDGWEHLRTYHIPFGQPDQRPPFAPKRSNRLAGVWVCGDHRDTGSIQGALFSGRRTATDVLASLA